MEVTVQSVSTVISPQRLAEFESQVLTTLRDPSSDARTVSRLFGGLPHLGRQVISYAEECLGGKRRIETLGNAITLIGFSRLEVLVQAITRSECIRLAQEDENHANPLAPTAPVHSSGRIDAIGS